MSLKYNIYFESGAAVFLVILFIYTRLQYNTQSGINREFQKLILLTFLADVLDVATAVTLSYSTAVPAGFNIFLNTAYFAAVAYLGYQFLNYAGFYVYRQKNGSVMFLINKVFLLLYFAVLAVNIFCGWIFSIGENGEYIHGFLYLAVYVVPCYLILCSAIILFCHFKDFLKWQRISIIFYYFLGFSGPAAQVLFFPDVLLAIFSAALGLLMMQFTMETPDYQRLMQTITELRGIKEELERAKEEAERAKENAQEANRVKTAFLANMSHEIRTPIHAVLGYNEIILKETKESHTAEYAINVQAAGKTLLSIVNDILDFADIDKGELKPEDEPYYTLSLLHDIILYAGYNAKKKGLELRLSIDESLPCRLSGDMVRLMQIFNNLLSNAVKYTMEGFIELRIKWRRISDTYGEIEAAVADSGIGLREEDIQKISESFLRFDPRKTYHIQGIGLGLAVVTRLLRLMGGSFCVESEYGSGSTFSFCVGQKIAAADEIGKIDYDSEQNVCPGLLREENFTAPSAHILAVDDNSMNLELFCGILRDTQISIDTAVNGKEALELIRKNSYQIIFLDHMMPVMDGMETLKIIREQGLCPDTPIIVLTANAIAGEKDFYLKEGFDNYLSKPIVGRQLKEMILFYLPKELIAGSGKETFSADTQNLEEDAQRSLTERLSGFLDTAVGLEYCCDSEEFYQEMLLAYLDNRKEEEITSAYEKEDWENYRILVHALKSTSLSIGAVDVSEQARALEAAAKEGNAAFIKERHTDALKNYRKLLSNLESVVLKPAAEETKTPVYQEEMPHILVVDDDAMNLKIAEKMLGSQYIVSGAESGSQALKFLKTTLPDIILLDLHMPEMDGFEVLGRLQKNSTYREIPVIFLTADDDRDMEIKGFKEGALDFIKKPFVADIMIVRVNRILQLDRLQKNLQQEVAKQTWMAKERTRKVERMSLQIMRTLAGTIDAKDKYTNGHSTRVAEYAREIAKRIGKNEKEQEDIFYMGLLHDIGKIGIPDEIINKDSKLTDEEYEIIKSHPVIGSDILKNISELPDIATGARWHHERYDGKGYPDRLKGEEIPETARIIGVADAYDAMTSKRSYRDVLPQKVVRAEIEKGRGSQFDPYFAEVMVAIIDEDTEYKLHER